MRRINGRFEIDYIIAIILIILNIIISILFLKYNIRLLVIPITLISFSLLYLTSKRIIVRSDVEKDVLFKPFLIVIYLLLLIAVVAIIFEEVPYSRPVQYFLIISFACGILAYLILTSKLNENRKRLLLFTIIFFCLNIYIIPQSLFPDIIGIDPWVHREFTNDILTNYSIPTGGYEFPLLHLLVGMVQISLGLSYKIAVICAISFILSIALATIYLIGNYFWNARIGLFGALLLGISPNFISLGIWIHPTTVALIISSFLIYLVIRSDEKSMGFTILMVILATAVIIAHIQIGLATLIFLFSYTVARRIYHGDLRRILSNWKGAGFTILFLVIMLGWWIYVTNVLIIPINLLRFIFQPELSNVGVFSIYPTSTIYEFLITILPYLIFYGLSMMGFLFSLSKNSRIDYSSYCIGGLIILLIPFISIPTAIGGLLAERWVYFAQILMAIPAAIGIFLLFYQYKKSIKRYAIALFFVIFILICLLNPSANIDNSSLTLNSIRYAHTASEIEIGNFIMAHYDGTIHIDFIYDLRFRNYINETYLIEDYLISRDFSNINGLILMRTEICTSRTHLIKQLDYLPYPYFTAEGYDKILDSNSVKIYSSNSQQ